MDAPAPGIYEIKAQSSFLLKDPPLPHALNTCTPGGYYHCILERRDDLPDFVQDQPSGPLGWLLDAWSSLQVAGRWVKYMCRLAGDGRACACASTWHAGAWKQWF